MPVLKDTNGWNGSEQTTGHLVIESVNGLLLTLLKAQSEQVKLATLVMTSKCSTPHFPATAAQGLDILFLLKDKYPFSFSP